MYVSFNKINHHIELERLFHFNWFRYKLYKELLLKCLRVWVLRLMAYQLCGLFNAKAILREEQWWYYLTHSWEDKGVHTFPKGICPKVNVIARLEYELAYYDSVVHRFNHYTTRTPPKMFENKTIIVEKKRRNKQKH